MKLTSHPRLYITAEHYARLQNPKSTAFLRDTAAKVESLANQFLRDDRITVDETGHNWHLIRARRLQTRIVTLLVQWKRTGNEDYRKAVSSDVRRMAAWEYWSWIAWRSQDARPEAIYDLSYGENAATLAIAFDALHGTLSEAETALFVDTARRRALQPYLHIAGAEKPPWWFLSPRSNWNSVCNGGAGMLALAMGDLSPESVPALKLAETGIKPFFESLDADGAWPEGIGYWNYGMRYAFMYLLSHERATGRQHRLLQRPGTAATLSFPLLFSPHGVPCSFGDVNNFSPLPFHLLAAERLGRQDVITELNRRLERDGVKQGTWPDAAELLIFHPQRVQRSAKTSWPRLSLQDGLEWGYVADRMPEPNLYVSVRGGTVDAPHTHHDLMSYFCLVGTEKLIENIPVDDYIDTTFSPRRFELYETSAASKNTILINGVSIAAKSSLETTLIEGRGYEGFRMDATAAMGVMRDGPAAGFCGRLLLMIKRKAILVVDRVELSHAGLVESRLHTFHRTKWEKTAVRVQGKENQLHIAFASSQPALLKRGTGLPTHPPRKPDTVIRYLSQAKVRHITMCYLLLPNGAGEVSLSEAAGRTTISGTGDVPFKLSFGTMGLDL